MAKRKVKSTGITFALNDPDMGEYERIGLAGLYMSLTAADAWAKDSLPSTVKDQAQELKKLIQWRLGEGGISLCLEWEDEDKALTALVKWAWQVKDGVFFLPAVHRKREYLDNYYLRVHQHNGLLNTFFQFPGTIKKADNQNTKKIEEFDESQTFWVSYRAIGSDAKLPQHQKATYSKGINGYNSVSPEASWIYPGSEPRFNNIPLKIRKEKSWVSLPRLTYLMLFAPLGCYYIRLPRTKAKIGMPENWAFIVPQVSALDIFHRYFVRCLSNHSNWPFNEIVAGLEDATLKYASLTSLRHLGPPGRHLSLLTVVMGNADYYHKIQKTRKNFLRIQLSFDAYIRYSTFNRIYPASKMIRVRQDASNGNGEEQASRYIRLPSSRERITANILANAPWYRELTFIPFWQRDQITEECKKSSEPVSPEQRWFSNLRKFERSQLMELSEEERMWDSPEEKRLLEILRYPVLWRLLNEEECAVGDRGGSRSLVERWDDTVEKWHRLFLRAKTRPLFRAVIHELLSAAQRRTRKWDKEKKQISRIGGTTFPSARDDATFHAWFWHEVNDPYGWQRIRDLALLALITFNDRRLSMTVTKEEKK